MRKAKDLIPGDKVVIGFGPCLVEWTREEPTGDITVYATRLNMNGYNLLAVTYLRDAEIETP